MHDRAKASRSLCKNVAVNLRRWIVLGAVLATACGSDPDDEVAGEASSSSAVPESRGEAWDIGQEVGARYGPFPEVFDRAAGSASSIEVDDWVVVILPEDQGALETFYAVVDDAVDRGFAATMREGGACHVDWQREDPDEGEREDDGADYQGTLPIDETLPADAEIVGADCRAVVARGDQAIDINLRADVAGGQFDRPGSPVVLIRTRSATPPAVQFARQDLDFEVLPATDDPVTFYLEPREGHPWGDEGACIGETGRSADTPMNAVAAAVTATDYAAQFELPATEVMTGGRRGAFETQAIPGGGPLIFVVATETGNGSDVLTCTNYSG